MLLVEGHDFSHIHVGQGVAHDDDEGLAEVGGDPPYASCRAQEPVLMSDTNPRAVYAGHTPVGIQDGISQMVYVDVDLVHARFRQELEDMLYDGLAYDRSHRLGDLTGEREEPRTLAGCQNHSFHPCDPPFCLLWCTHLKLRAYVLFSRFNLFPPLTLLLSSGTF